MNVDLYDGTAFIFLTAVLNVLEPNYFFAVERISMRLRASCMALIYRKVRIAEKRIMWRINYIIQRINQCYCLLDSEIEPREH